MDNKNKSGQSPLFPLYFEDMTFWQSSVIFAIIFAELFVMYVIQNAFNERELMLIGVICLALSLVVSFGAVIIYSRYIKRKNDKNNSAS